MHAFAQQKKSVSEVKPSAPVNAGVDVSTHLPVNNSLHSNCACGGGCPNCLNNQPFRIQRKSFEISSPTDSAEKEADEVARKVVNGQPAQIRETGVSVNRSGEGPAQTAPAFHSALENSKGGGIALDNATRREMEAKMGADLSGVRIHTSGAAHQMNENVSARAFTYGQDIFFRQGEFNLASKQGKELLAHELVHTVQQGSFAKNMIARQVIKNTPSKVWTKELVSKQYYSVKNKEGGFYWVVQWQTNRKNGWIVQKIEHEINFTDCTGETFLKPDPDNSRTYWEAWRVIDGKAVGGDPPGGTDGWAQITTEALIATPPLSGHKGTWETTGTVYFVDSLNKKSNWEESNGVWTIYSDPKINSAVLLTRKAGGQVSICGSQKTWFHKPLKSK